MTNTIERILLEKIDSLEAQLSLSESKLRVLQEAQYSRENLDRSKACELLHFLSNRLIHQYDENPRLDYHVKSREIASRFRGQ